VVPVTVVGATEAEEEIVVGASKREQTLGTVASAVTVLTADRLRRWGYRTLAEALEGVVGLYVVDDRMMARVGIRGVQLLGDANTRILVLIDGSPLNEPWSQFVDTGHALPIHLDDVARIEIIRGPVSAIYGTNAFLGIINIITLEADKSTPAYARLGLDSFGTVSGNAGFRVGVIDRQVRGYASWIQSNGEELTYELTGDPPLFHTSADRLRGMSSAVVVHFDRLFFQARAHSRERELPGAPYDSHVGYHGNTHLDRMILGEAGYTRDLGARTTLAGRAYIDAYQHRTHLLFTSDSAFRSTGESLWYGGELRGLFDLAKVVPRWNLHLTTGIAAESIRTRSEAGDVGADSRVTVRRNIAIEAGYAELNAAPLSWLSIAASLRYDLNSEFENNRTHRAAVFLSRGNQYGLKLLYAEGFRNPSVFEAFFEDGKRFRPTCAPECASIGATLLPELAKSYELVLWGSPLPGAKVRVSAWQWRLDRLLLKTRRYDPTLLAEIIQFGNEFLPLYSRGVEAEATYRDTNGWLGFASATLSAVEREGEDFAVNAPEFTAKAGISTPLLRHALHVSTEAALIGPRNTRDNRPEGRIRSETYLGWNAVLYAPDIGGLDCTIGVRNILGTREMIPAQTEYDRQAPESDLLWIPGSGRVVFARIGYRY